MGKRIESSPDLRTENVRNRIKRREYVAVSTVFGTAFVTGCLGDDEVEPTDDDDVTDDADVDDDDDDEISLEPDDSDDTDDDDADDAAEEEIVRHDVTLHAVTGPPLPADLSLSVRGDPSFNDSAPGYWYRLAGRSFADRLVHAEALKDLQYSPGFLEIYFRDEEPVCWWSGKPMDAEDFITYAEFVDWQGGGADLDAEPNIIAFEQIDQWTARIALADTWNEQWGLQQTMVEAPYNRLYQSSDWTGPWVEQFRDTGGDMDAVEDIREEVSDVFVREDDELIHHHHNPFEFRMDDSIGEIGENFIEFELVPEKNGTKRAFVDDINYTKWRMHFTEEEHLGEELFLSEDRVIGGDPEEEYDFPVKEITFVREFDQWGWTMNAEVHPTDNPYFRRAWKFAERRTDWEEPVRLPPEFAGHPFMTEERLRTWASDRIVDSMTRYGLDADWDRAEEELVTGGFERNDDGDWLMQEAGAGQDGGEPIDLTIGRWDFLQTIEDAGSDWFADIRDFGLQTEVVADLGGDDPWRVEAHYVGGLLPEFTFESLFGESNLSWAAWNPQFDESVDAPPLGEADAPHEDWIEYDTRAMTDRLGITVEAGPYQDLVDRLAWVSNQLVPRTPVVVSTQRNIVNDNRWHVTEIEDAPDRWNWIPRDRMWFNGVVSYVPEDER